MYFSYYLHAGLDFTSLPPLSSLSFFFLGSMRSLVDIMSKHENTLETHVADSDVSMSDFNGTVEDAKDMDRLGRAQQLKVIIP